MADQVVSAARPASAATNGQVALPAATDEKVLDANPSRAEFILTNDGSGDAWISYGPAAAVASHGFCLKAGGGVCADDSWPGEVHAISTAGTNLCVIEKVYSVGDDSGERPTGADTFVPSGPGDTPLAPPTVPQQVPPPPLNPAQ